MATPEKESPTSHVIDQTNGSGQRPRLTERERRIVEALCARAFPPGPRLPATAEEIRIADRLEEFFSDMPAYAFQGYRALLWTIERGAILGRWRPFSKLPPAKQDAYLESLHHSRIPQRRQMLKLCLTLLKLVRYSQEDVVKAFNYRAEKPRAPGVHRPLGEPHPAVIDGRGLTGTHRVEADVIVIGTGAGGAVVGKELQELGKRVVFIEEGDYYTRVDFNRRAVEMSRLLYRDSGLVAAMGKPGIILPLGRTVGGTTTINSGTCFRLPDPVVARWHDQLGLPFTSEQLQPVFDRVEEIINVEKVPLELAGNVAKVIGRGAEKLGYSHGPLRRNTRGCRASGVCAFGCPTDAKQSMQLSYVPRALAAGAIVHSATRVERLLVEDGRVQGVIAHTQGGGELIAKAPAVVVACGSLYTPVLLKRNGLCGRSGQLGRNLTIHPAAKALALFDEEIRGWEGVPQGYQVDHFKKEGLLYEGASVPPDFGSTGLPFFGKRFAEVMEAYDRVAIFGFMVADTSRGQIRVGPGGKPLAVYNVNDSDRDKLVRGIGILARLFFAGGAKAVFPAVFGFDELTSLEDVERLEKAKLSAWDLELTAFHPLGTARMGTSPETSVIGPDFQTHDVRGLYIVDGSIFPTSLGVNPQITIMAFATLAARGIAEQTG